MGAREGGCEAEAEALLDSDSSEGRDEDTFFPFTISALTKAAEEEEALELFALRKGGLVEEEEDVGDELDDGDEEGEEALERIKEELR